MLIRLSTPTRDVAVTADGDATVADLANALGSGGTRLWVRDATLPGAPPVFLDPASPLGSSGLYDGAMLASGSTVPVDAGAVPPSLWSLRVAEGPAAGLLLPLPDGTSTIGRSLGNTVVLADMDVSREHARVHSDVRQVVVEDLGTKNGTWQGDQRLTRPTPLKPGDTLRLGQSVLVIERTGSQRALVSPDGAGGLVLNRTPSRRRAPARARIEFPPPPAEMERRGFPWLSAILPLAAAVGLAVWQKQPTYLAFALIAPLTMAGQVWTERRAERRRQSGGSARYSEDLAAARAQLENVLGAQASYLNAAYPTGIEAARIAASLESRVWERSYEDPEALGVRLGTGSVNVDVEVRAQRGRDVPATTLPGAPIHVGLADAHVLGLSGTLELVDDVARSLVVQLAALHSSDDLRFHLLAPNGVPAGWDFVRWLPHAWDPVARCAQIGSDEASIHARMTDLQALIEGRSAVRRGSNIGPPTPAVVVIMLDAGDLRLRTDVAEVLSGGGQFGVYGIALETDERNLPEECRAMARVTREGLQLHVTGRPETSGAVEGCAADVALAAARALTPLRRVGGERVGGGLPTSVRLVAMLGGTPSVDDVDVAWQKSTGLRVPIGFGAQGASRLDLVHDGPHALVGGMTGMGKSEFLKTWIAAMALAAPPEDLSLLLIEFKGISAFRDLQHLPHTVGAITNLNRQLAQRALDSLRAELTRRQRQLADADADDISDYRATRARRPELPPFPRLVVVVDEFAEMKKEMEDVVQGLVSIARTGRSLGVHLVLATQRPGDAVTPEISGNAALRVSLRLQSGEDSMLVLDSPIAETLPAETPGRAYVKIGERQPVAVQTARVGGPAELGGTRVEVSPWAARDAGRPLSAGTAETATTTDLQALVRVMRDAAARSGATAPFHPWTAPLPTLLPLDRVLEPDGAPVHEPGLGPVVGLADEPEEQRQTPFALPLTSSHVAVVGGLRSGRTTTLRTAAVSWAITLPPDLLHIHVVDGARAALDLARLPHTGTAVNADDPRALRLIQLLGREVDARLEQLGKDGFTDVQEQWSARPGDRMPWNLVVIDRLDLLLPALENNPAGVAFERLLSLGAAAGITVLASSDETLLRSRWLNRFPARLVLRLAGADATVAGIPKRLPLGELAPGRAYDGEALRLVQVAVLGGDASGPEQRQQLTALADRLEQLHLAVPPGRRAARLQELPQLFGAAGLPRPTTAGDVPLGVGGDTASVVTLTRAQLPLVVVGTAGTGRSSTLARVAAAWTSAGLPVTAVAGDGSPLLDLELPGLRSVHLRDVGAAGVPALLADPTQAVVLDGVDARDLPDELSGALTAAAPRALFATSMGPMGTVPTPVARLARQGTLLLLTPADRFAYRGYGLDLDQTEVFSEPAGRAWLINGGRRQIVQIARQPLR